MYQAQETANVGHQVISETKNYFSALTDLQVERAAVILAAQPNCRLSRDWNITVRKDENSSEDKPLCVTEEDRREGNVTKINLMPLNKKMFNNDIEILSAFSDYLDVLTAYTKDSTYPVEGMIDNALGYARNINDKKGFTAEQKNAISGLVMFLIRLSTEAKNGQDIGNLLKTEGLRQSDNLELLKNDIIRLKATYDNTMRKDLLNFSAELFYKRNQGVAKDNSLENSRKFVALRNQIETSIINPTAAEIAINKYQEYNKGLISIIDGNITNRKLREKEIEIQKDNLKEGLIHIKDLIKELSPLLIAAI